MNPALQFDLTFDYTSRPLEGDSDYAQDESYKDFKDYLTPFTDNPPGDMHVIIVFKCTVNVFCVFGIVFNSVFVVVLTRHGFKDTTNLLLVAIAVSDIVFFMAQVSHLVVQIVNGIFRYARGELFEFFYRVVSPWAMICVTSSLCLVAVMAVERLTAVCFPFLVSRIFTSFRTKFLVTLIYVFVIVIVYMNNLSPVNQEIVYEHEYNYLATANKSDDIRFTDDAQIINGFNSSLLVLIPITVIIVCYVTIVLKLHLTASTLTRLTSGAAHSKRAHVKRGKLNRMLLILMAVTLLSFLPSPMFDVYLMLAHQLHGRSETFLQNSSFMVTQVCQLVFSSINSVVCVVMSSTFAKTFKQIVCRV